MHLVLMMCVSYRGNNTQIAISQQDALKEWNSAQINSYSFSLIINVYSIKIIWFYIYEVQYNTATILKCFWIVLISVVSWSNIKIHHYTKNLKSPGILQFIHKRDFIEIFPNLTMVKLTLLNILQSWKEIFLDCQWTKIFNSHTKWRLRQLFVLIESNIIKLSL